MQHLIVVCIIETSLPQVLGQMLKSSLTILIFLFSFTLQGLQGHTQKLELNSNESRFKNLQNYKFLCLKICYKTSELKVYFTSQIFLLFIN